MIHPDTVLQDTGPEGDGLHGVDGPARHIPDHLASSCVGRPYEAASCPWGNQDTAGRETGSPVPLAGRGARPSLPVRDSVTPSLSDMYSGAVWPAYVPLPFLQHRTGRHETTPIGCEEKHQETGTRIKPLWHEGTPLGRAPGRWNGVHARSCDAGARPYGYALPLPPHLLAAPLPHTCFVVGGELRPVARPIFQDGRRLRHTTPVRRAPQHLPAPAMEDLSDA